MCHYTIEWDTPAACPSNLPSFPVEGEDDGEEVIYEDASGPHRTTRGAVKRTQVYGKVVAALVMLGVMAAVVLAVQIYRVGTNPSPSPSSLPSPSFPPFADAHASRMPCMPF